MNRQADPLLSLKPPATQGRIDAIDIARGIALLAMAAYHFSWDLFWFRLVGWNVATGFGWKASAVAIAASFLFLVGVSLVLAHRHSFRWRAIGVRFARIALAAALVSVGTWYALGDQFVRFGILHVIAVSGILALPFLRISIAVTAIVVAAVVSLPFWARAELFNLPALVWTGLATAPPAAVDYVPVVPWFAAVLAGVLAGRLAAASGLFDRLAKWQATGRLWRAAAFSGRHSLAIYLLHQPILFGLVWGMVMLGLTPDPAERDFIVNCSLTCSLDADGASCERICRCTLGAMKSAGIWDRLLANPGDPALTDRMRDSYALCHLDGN